MSDEGDFGDLFFPNDPAAPDLATAASPVTGAQPEATPDDLRARTVAELVEELLMQLATGQRRTLAEVASDPLHADGSVEIASMTAVYLLSVIGKRVGKQPLVNLRSVDPEDLRSVLGVARLVHKALVVWGM